MQTDFLDKHERQYLRSCQWPPAAWLRAFFWYFLPAIGAATVAMQWSRGIDVISMLLAGGVFLALSLLYFPLARISARPVSSSVINWTGIVRIVPAAQGRGREDYIGETLISLPIGWDERFRAMSGRMIRAHGVPVRHAAAPRVQVLSLDNRSFVRAEVPLGLTEIDLPEFYFALALVPIGVMIGIAIKSRFHLEYLVFFGLVSAGFALHGMYVVRRNQAIQRGIAEAYLQNRSPDLLYAGDRR